MKIGHGRSTCKGEHWSSLVVDEDDWTFVEVDLSSVHGRGSWIDCGFLVRLGAVLYAASLDGVPIRFRSRPQAQRGHGTTLPSTSGPVPYAARMGLRRLLEELDVDHDLPATGRRDPRDRFVELTRLGPGQPCDDVIDVVEANVLAWDDHALAEQLRGALYELALNIEEHADASGFVMAQWYDGRQTPTLELSVADAGQGIRSSLAAAGHAFDDDASAVKAAATTRVSSKSSDGGFGIMNVRKSIAHNLGGSIRIGSGSAVLRSVGRGTPFVATVTPWSGTVIDASFTWRPKP